MAVIKHYVCMITCAVIEARSVIGCSASCFPSSIHTREGQLQITRHSQLHKYWP